MALHLCCPWQEPKDQEKNHIEITFRPDLSSGRLSDENFQSLPTFTNHWSKELVQKNKAHFINWEPFGECMGQSPSRTRPSICLLCLSLGTSAWSSVALWPHQGLCQTKNSISHWHPGEQDEVNRFFSSCRKPEKINLRTERWCWAAEEIYEGGKSRPRSLVLVSLGLSTITVLWLEEISRGHLLQPPAS